MIFLDNLALCWCLKSPCCFELAISAPKLGYQILQTPKTGHFYYSDKTEVGSNRRQTLAKQLYNLGLR